MTDKIIRFQSDTDPKYGLAPEKRSVESLLNSGVICLEKPKGPTTHQIAHHVKEVFNLKKVGHAGQLDPPMSGLVAVLMGDACKLTSFLTQSDRSYSLRMQFNRTLDQKQIEDAMAKFTGKIKQVPPLRSRVRRVLRTRMIYEINIIDWRPKNIKVFIRCEAGTYLRKLFYDMGRLLRSNVNLSGMKRLGIGPLDIEQAVTVDQFKEIGQAYYKGEEKALRNLITPIDTCAEGKTLVVEDKAIYNICCGSPLYLDNVCQLDRDIEPDDVVLIKSLKGEIVCVARAAMDSETMEKEKKGVAAHPARVVMKAETYKINGSQTGES